MTNAAINPMLRVLSIRNFRLLWLGGSTSILGSQFSFIALPWLALQLTGDPLAIGIVLALAGIPRALFIIIGGTLTDRFSPRIILIICDWINFALSGLLAALVFTGLTQIWMLYMLSLITGLLSGFVMPAANSILPHLVPDEDLQAGNSILTGSMQLFGFVGPALAGLVIGAYSQSTYGIVIAFGVDALTFAISAIMLGMMNHGARQMVGSPDVHETIGSSLRVVAVYLWNHANMKFLLIIYAAINFFFVGPLLVGIPVLAAQRLPEGARAFGFLMSAFAGGSLVGSFFAGILPKANGRAFGILLVSSLASFGIVLVSFSWITLTWVDFVLMLFVGVGYGYIGLIMFTWIQQRTPREMLGRVMGMIMFVIGGLLPLSQALSGAISSWNLTWLFVLSGGLLLLVVLWVAFQPALKSLGNEVAGD